MDRLYIVQQGTASSVFLDNSFNVKKRFIITGFVDIAEAMARKALPVLGDYQQVQPHEKVREYKKKRTGGQNKQK